MKLVTFEEFCALPDGTIYQQWQPHFLGELAIRGDVLRTNGKPCDFLTADLTAAPLDGSSIGHKDKELVFCMPSMFGRWALYDDKIRYLVYESADLQRLAGWLLNPQKALDDMNGDDMIRAEVPLDVWPG